MTKLAKALQAAAGNAGAATYIEDVFSTYLYTGNGSTQTITNGIDLDGEGGLVWLKNRGAGTTDHRLFDTNRGVYKSLSSNLTDAEDTSTSSLTAFNANGFSLSGFNAEINDTSNTYASWTFRKAPKFFDVVTYTGTGSDQHISHNLGSTPAFIICKATSTTSNWFVTARKAANSYSIGLSLNTTAAEVLSSTLAYTENTDTTFAPHKVYDDTGSNNANVNGVSYVAYLFAHDAGGFGDSGDESVISCGSYTGNGSTNGPVIDLGWEPQLVIARRVSSTGNWVMADNMRGMPVGSDSKYLFANTSVAEGDLATFAPTPTGFKVVGTNVSINGSGASHIYIAIRRGPMKTPEDATTVFTPAFASSSGTYTATAGFPVDAVIYKDKSATANNFNRSRLVGPYYLVTNSTAAQVSNANGTFDSNTSFNSPSSADYSSWINWMFRRAPGFFDVVCYTGNGSASGQTLSHNLGVVPEFIIVKRRDSTAPWICYQKDLGGADYYIQLSSTDPKGQDASKPPWLSTPTSTYFYVGDGTWWSENNASGATYFAYLFASCPGVSKVGSYTGNGTSQTIDCGFSNGARFFLVKASSSTGSWYVWDSARGIVSGNDPFLKLNATDAEDPYGDVVDTTSSGIIVNQVAPSNINTNGVTYIFLAIA